MTCKNCGFHSEEELKICPQCNTEVGIAENVEVNETVVETPPEEVPSVEETSVEETVASEKSRKGLWIGLGVAGAVVVTLVLAFAITFFTAENFFRKTFSSEESYFRYVTSKNSDEMAEQIGNMLEQRKPWENFSLKGEATIKLSDKIINLIEEDSESVEMDWLSDIQIGYDIVYGKSVNSQKITAGINSTDIFTYNVINDNTAGKSYWSLPGINDTYICVDNLQEDYYSDDSADSTMPLQNLLNALPEGEVAEKLIKKYIDILLENIEDVTAEEEVLQIEGVSQETTVYLVRADKELTVKILKDVIEEAKQDAEIEKIVKAFATAEDEDVEAVYSEFKEALDEVLKEAEASDADEYFDYKTWVDNSGKIVGYEFSDKEASISVKMPVDGNTMGYQLESVLVYDDYEEISSVSGRFIVDEKINGDFSIISSGLQIAEVKLSDVDAAAMAEGRFDGVIEMRLNRGLSQLMYNGSDIENVIENYKLRMDIDGTGEKANATIELIEGSDVLISVEASGEIAEGKPVAIPENAVNSDDYEAMMEWYAGLNMNAVRDSLNKAGVPQELISPLMGDLLL